MEKKKRNILLIIVAVVVILPLLLILLGTGAFVITDFVRYGDGEVLGSMMKYLGIAIIVIGVPVALYLTRKKDK